MLTMGRLPQPLQNSLGAKRRGAGKQREQTASRPQQGAHRTSSAMEGNRDSGKTLARSREIQPQYTATCQPQPEPGH